MTAALPKPSGSEPSSFSRAISVWRDGQRREAPTPEAGERGFAPAPERGLRAYAPYAVALTLALGAGAAAASLATAPALTDSLDTVAAIDARSMGLATHLDPTGQQTKAATLNRDVGAMKSEITRLQRALDQSRSNQAAQSKTAAGQAASNQEEVKSLKSEIVKLQNTLESTREASASKIEQLTAKVEQSKQEAAKVAEVRDRLDRMERQSAEKLAAAEKIAAEKVAEKPFEKPSRADPETTGSISAPRAEQPRAQPEPEQREVASRDMGPIVRNWTVREVVRGVALLEGRHGMIEVVRGARAPGMGRIRSIERRDGQWVVVTDRGVILERADL